MGTLVGGGDLKEGMPSQIHIATINSGGRMERPKLVMGWEVPSDGN